MASETVERRVQLPLESAEQLRLLAQVRRTTEDEVVAKALDVLFRLADVEEAQGERREVSALSEGSLSRIWDNDEDAAYDNWRELYGVPPR